MYVRSVSIRNLRTFEEATVRLRVPTDPSSGDSVSNVTLVLGNNGAGKTSVLRAIALATLAPLIVSGSGYVPYSLVRRVGGAAAKEALVSARVVLNEQDESRGERTLSLRLKPTKGFVDRFEPVQRRSWHEPMWDEESAAFFVVGYGANRRADMVDKGNPEQRARARALRYQRVASLFEDHVGLVPLSAWLGDWRRRNPGRHKQVVQLMNALLEPHAQLLAEPALGEYLFELRGSRLPFAALSDGYRAYISWISDLLYHVCMGAPSGAKLVESRGVVLIDEVDLHLHPEWQREVIPTLARALPLVDPAPSGP